MEKILRTDVKIIDESIRDLFMKIEYDMDKYASAGTKQPSDYATVNQVNVDANLEQVLETKLKLAIDDRRYWMHRCDELKRLIENNCTLIDECESKCLHFVNKLSERAIKFVADMQLNLDQVNKCLLANQEELIVCREELGGKLKMVENLQTLNDNLREELNKETTLRVDCQQQLCKLKADHELMEKIANLSIKRLDYLEKYSSHTTTSTNFTESDQIACRNILLSLHNKKDQLYSSSTNESLDKTEEQDNLSNSTGSNNMQNVTIYKSESSSSGPSTPDKDEDLSQSFRTLSTSNITSQSSTVSSIEALNYRRNGVLVSKDDLSKLTKNAKSKRSMFSKSYSKD